MAKAAIGRIARDARVAGGDADGGRERAGSGDVVGETVSDDILARECRTSLGRDRKSETGSWMF